MTQVLGTQGLQSKLAQIGELAAGHSLMEIALAGGFVVEGAMKKNIRDVDFVDTGATLNSTQARPVSGGTVEAEVAVGPTTDYAIYGEFGTMSVGARPFARPSLDEHKDAVLAAMAAAMRKGVV